VCVFRPYGRTPVFGLARRRSGDMLAATQSRGGLAMAFVIPNSIRLATTDMRAGFKAEIKALFMKAVELEYRYAEDTMPRGVLGLNASMFKGYLRFIANRRATQIGLEALFPNEENPFPWMSEMIDLKKERNFFETRVIEYQSGGALSWD
jgi:ribonucleoside-diphosphate reductase beta chain